MEYTMINLYTWPTSNGRKISIMLEEIGLPYRVMPINIGADEQFTPEFLAISPNNKIPAIVDDGVEGGPLTIFESGAILFYLAEKTGRLLPRPMQQRMAALAWLNWQVSGLGPMFFELGFFAIRSPEKLPSATAQFTTEVDRLLRVMDRRLTTVPFLGGEAYSIADISAYPGVIAATTYLSKPLQDTIAAIPNVHRWLDAIGIRPAVKRGMTVPTL
jgi:GST-like protein